MADTVDMKASAVDTSTNVWQQIEDLYQPGSNASQVRRLPPAIYRFVNTDRGWFLQKTANRYTFPYKLYGINQDIIERVTRAWKNLPSNFGVMLNGLKGTGKTITAQQIVNWAVGEGIMVLNVQSPVPLSAIMQHVEQPMLVLFDEFEKTHEQAEHQQALLSAIDGLSKNEHRRMFLFTTNTKKINDNLIDRPSRIRYCWEFGRLRNDLIEMIMDDLLRKDLAHLKSEIMSYLNTRTALSIDVVKTVIMECNIFEEAPSIFKPFMNLSEKEPAAFKLEIVGEKGDLELLSDYFRPTSNAAWLSGLFSKTGQQAFIQDYISKDSSFVMISTSGQRFELLGPTPNENEWICHVQIPTYKLDWITPRIERAVNIPSFMWLDEKPADWKLPSWARKAESGKTLELDEVNAHLVWQHDGRIYGTDRPKRVVVRFTQNNEPFYYDHRSLMDVD